MKNGTMWYDTAGKPIQAHGGMILEEQGVYYWYGENKGAPNHNRENGGKRVDIIGISCYTSVNLVDWKYEGLVLKAELENTDSFLHPSKVCERPKVIHNKSTGEYVLWFHADTCDYSYAGVGVAISDSPLGPFRLVRVMQPNRQDSRDMTLFEDTDGKAYLFHSSNFNKTMYISRLTDDYRDVDGFYSAVMTDQEREAPAVIKEQGKYYMVTSGCSGWSPNSALYAVSPQVIGGWKLIDNPCEGQNRRKTFGGQSTWLLRTKGKIYLLLDHWVPDNLQESGYSILPVIIENGEMTVRWEEEFMGIK